MLLSSPGHQAGAWSRKGASLWPRPLPGVTPASPCPEWPWRAERGTTLQQPHALPSLKLPGQACRTQVAPVSWCWQVPLCVKDGGREMLAMRGAAWGSPRAPPLHCQGQTPGALELGHL